MKSLEIWWYSINEDSNNIIHFPLIKLLSVRDGNSSFLTFHSRKQSLKTHLPENLGYIFIQRAFKNL